MQTSFVQLANLMFHFSVENKASKFTYSLLKSRVYVINQIRDLTKSNDMHFFPDIYLKEKSLLLMVF